jgi:UDPglucose--hexose-1-phosphate uridylyltransferase
MSEDLLLKNTHRRFNPLTGEWVLVCAKRNNRPWQGAEEEELQDKRVEHDSSCYLCPRNTRITGDINPEYDGVYIFKNDFSALIPLDKMDAINSSLFKAEEVEGVCRVLCFSPRHDLTLPQMEVPAIEKVVDAWQQQFTELSEDYTWVQLFENKGAIMGCSNPHPHGQIWASNFMPNELEIEDVNQKKYFQENGSILLVDYAKHEMELKERIVDENEDWLVVVPYWATWPFETLLLPKTHIANWQSVTKTQKTSLAEIMKTFLQRYDRLFNVSFPYSMGWHCAPNIDSAEKYSQLHAHFYPPLLRSASVRKFMVGYEMLAQQQRDFTPEFAAQKLREI